MSTLLSIAGKFAPILFLALALDKISKVLVSAPKPKAYRLYITTCFQVIFSGLFVVDGYLRNPIIEL